MDDNIKVEAYVEAIDEEVVVPSANIPMAVSSGLTVKTELCRAGFVDEPIECPAVPLNNGVIDEQLDIAEVKAESGGTANAVQSLEIVVDVCTAKVETAENALTERYDICPFGRVGLNYTPFPITGYPTGFESAMAAVCSLPDGFRNADPNWRLAPIMYENWTPAIKQRFERITNNKQRPNNRLYCPACTTFIRDRNVKHFKSPRHINAELAMLRASKSNAVGTSSGGPLNGPADLEETSPYSAFYVPPLVAALPVAAPNVTKSKKEHRRDVENQRKEATELAGAYGHMLAAAPGGVVTTFPRFRDLQPLNVDFDALPSKPGGGKKMSAILRNKKDCLQKLVYRLSFELTRGGEAIFPPQLIVKPVEVNAAVATLKSWQPLADSEDSSVQNPRARTLNNRKLRQAAFVIRRARIICDYFRLLGRQQDGAIPSPVAGLPPLRVVDVWSRRDNGKNQPRNKGANKQAKKMNKQRQKRAEGNSEKKENRRKPKQRKVKQEPKNKGSGHQPSTPGGRDQPGLSGQSHQQPKSEPYVTNKKRRRMKKAASAPN